MKHDIALKIKVKEMLMMVKLVAPGRSVELRIPHYGAIQCVGGSIHRRGTPPNLVEMNAKTFMSLIENPYLWETHINTGDISASGLSSDLSEVFLKISGILNDHKEVNKE